jgi:hypothetical protein
VFVGMKQYKKGCPIGRGGPEWYVEPDFIAKVILDKLLSLENDESEKNICIWKM